jgi:hypothetical protein
MRRTVITEDMISRALNESIDEFMLEEGAWDGLKNWFNKLGNTKFMRGLNNAVNMYMDYKTNGQWNREYNSYANDGNSKTVEMYYLDKWLKYHLGQMQYIEERSKSPNSAYDEIDWEQDENGKKVGRQRRFNYKTVKEYAENNITSEAFNLWIRNYIPDRKALKLIDEYIDTYCNKVENLRQANNFFDSNSFLTSDIGKEYTKTKSSELNRYDFNGQYKAKIDQQKADAEQKQREAEAEAERKQRENEVNETKKCHEGINAILSSIGKNIIKHTKPVSTSLVNSEIQYVEGRAAYYIPNKEIKDAFINWFSESLREYQQNLSKLKKHLNLNDFLAKYPKYKI